jgi:hypothetical protein
MELIRLRRKLSIGSPIAWRSCLRESTSSGRGISAWSASVGALTSRTRSRRRRLPLT